MSDPRDLEALKERAVARREIRIPADSTTTARQLFYIDQWKGAETDLDRAVELAEQWERQCEEVVGAGQGVRERLTQKLDHARHNFRVLNDEAVDLQLELDQAREDVLMLRDELDKALRVLDLAYAAGKEMARCGITLAPDWPKIQDEAYEAVGEYLYPGPPQPEPFVTLADTKHYEHRTEDTESGDDEPPNSDDPGLPSGFDYIELADLLDALDGVVAFSRTATFDEVDGERDATERARRLLARYGRAT